ncbi:hypothetical protein Patl1_11335 [Pistacia atlantica]|uniref:Uncharacterized protein n=1 Tax=Pistacia atlantica TaxID=434234 RepID=A0ACC1A5E0_9ROSI|nr:hypothetical protein Patl1_11335 [Pistacia atlantica]
MARNYVRDNVPFSRFGILVAQLESTSELNQRVKTASVVGGTGYVASLLIKLLLQKGYSVNTNDVMEEKCGSAAICFVSFLLEILDSKADGRNKYLEMIYVWAAAGKQPDLEKHMWTRENLVNFVLSPPKIPDLWCWVDNFSGYSSEMRMFTPTQVLGMLFSNLKSIAEKNLNAAVVDCCIGIPVYFTDLQRRAVLDAATIAAGFKKGQLKILGHSFDRSCGGRDFDEALFQHFAAKFKDEYKIDVFQNARACLVLGLPRDEFERISAPILDRVKRPLEKALAETGHSVENNHMVEVVGSGSRVPSIMKILTEFFGKEPRRTMNASECVARGCALECAILSPTFKVREFQVNESFPFSIALSWKGSAPEAQNEAADNQQSTIVFPKGNPIPSVKALTFYRAGTFTLDGQ